MIKNFLFENRLTKFADHGLGLERNNKVELVEHSEEWKEIYSDEADLILHRLNLPSLKLYHCGSTSIPGIVAKPIIDIVGAVDNLEDFDGSKKKLEEIGYEYKGEYGIVGRRYCVLYNPEKTIGYCHLHIFEDKSPEFIDHLKFRNYLRLNRDAALKYEAHKKASNLPRDQYSAAKADIIAELLEEATSKENVKCFL